MNKFSDLHYPVQRLPVQLGINYQQMNQISKATAEMSLESLYYYLAMKKGTIRYCFDNKYEYCPSNNQFVIIIAQSGKGKDTSGMLYKPLINTFYREFIRETVALSKVIGEVTEGLVKGKKVVIDLGFIAMPFIEDPSIKSPTLEAINLKMSTLTAYKHNFEILRGIVNDTSYSFELARGLLKAKKSVSCDIHIFDMVKEFTETARYLTQRTIIGARNTELGDFVSSMSKSDGGLSSLISLYEYETHRQDRASAEFKREQLGDSALTFTLYGQHAIVKEQLKKIEPYGGGRQRIRMVYIPKDTNIDHNNSFHLGDRGEIDIAEKQLLRYLDTSTSKHICIETDEFNCQLAGYQKYITELIRINLEGLYDETELCEIVNSYTKRYFGNYFFKFLVDHCILWDKDEIDIDCVRDAFQRTVYYTITLVFYMKNFLTNEEDAEDDLKVKLVKKIKAEKRNHRTLTRSFSEKQKPMKKLLDVWIATKIVTTDNSGFLVVSEERALEKNDGEEKNTDLEEILLPELEIDCIKDDMNEVKLMFETVQIGNKSLDYDSIGKKEKEKLDYRNKIEGICALGGKK